MTRAFASTPVQAEVVSQLIADAALAPSAGKSQGWHAVVLSGAETRTFWDCTLAAERRDGFAFPQLLDAPVVILIVTDPGAYVRRYAEQDKAHTGLGAGRDAWPVPYWTVDAAMASMVILLGAEAHGLGALFFAVFNGEPELRAALSLPDEMEIVGAIALGRPLPSQPGRSSSRPTRRPDEIIHLGRWRPDLDSSTQFG